MISLPRKSNNRQFRGLEKLLVLTEATEVAIKPNLRAVDECRSTQKY